jgi:hypothetical protein
VDSIDPAVYPNQFIFRVDGQEVCEKFYAQLLGMVTPEGFKSKTWIDEVAMFDNDDRKKKSTSTDGQMNRQKRDDAFSHILTVVDSQIMDKSAHANYDNHLYLPYNTMTAFFDEYVYLRKHMEKGGYAQRSTFATAMSEVIKMKKRKGISIRFSGAKGKCAGIACDHAVQC